MKVLWLIAGVLIGFVGASVAARSARGRQVLEDVNGRATEFGRAVADSYRARQAELGSGG